MYKKLRECQAIDSRANKIVNVFASTHPWQGRQIRKFPQQYFPVFFKNEDVNYNYTLKFLITLKLLKQIAPVKLQLKKYQYI